MSQHPFQVLALENGAELIFTPLPGSKDVDMETSVEQLKAHGVTMMLTLLSDDELEDNNAITLSLSCLQQKIRWFQLPIEDDEAPTQEFETKWQQYKEAILDEVKRGGKIAAHCKGGQGRTGTIIAMILLELGWTPEKIRKEMKAVKPQCLQIQKQLDYLNRQVVDSDERF